MKEPFKWSKVQNYLSARLFKKVFVRNLHDRAQKKAGHALLYHKTDCLAPGFLDTYIHTNNWEIRATVRILNRLGYWVDVIDRRIDDAFVPPDAYDLFIGLGVDDSGRHYSRYAAALSRAIRILYATNADPAVGNANILKRQIQFQERHSTQLPATRLTKNIDLRAAMNVTDYIFSVGNDYANDTLRRYGKDLYKIYLSTAPHLTFTRQALVAKRKDHWLFFAGDGNFKKGLDLVFEAFAKIPRVHLYVCTTLEPAFRRHYQPLIKQTPNIHLEPTMRMGGARFNQLTDRCGFTILPSATEGTPTSLTSCLRRGLIPVVTREAGLDIGDFGFLLPSVAIDDLAGSIKDIAGVTDADFRRRIIAAYRNSFHYTQQAFEASFSAALLDVLQREGKI